MPAAALSLRFLTYEDLAVVRTRVIRDATDGRASAAVFGLSEKHGDLGIKNLNALQSALDRQQVGAGDHLKYDTPFLNAATLAFGLVKNHPYHDGNKRTALVAMLAHLDKNRFLLPGIDHKTLTQVMENIAANRTPVDAGVTVPKSKKRRLMKKHNKSLAEPRSQADMVVEDLARFLGELCRGNTRFGYRSMNYHKLRSLLEAHGFMLEGPISGNRMAVYRTQRRTVLGITSKKTVHAGTISWPGDSRSLDLQSLDLIRKKLSLTPEDGYDDAAFYDLEESVDSIVNQYRAVLRRLETR